MRAVLRQLEEATRNDSGITVGFGVFIGDNCIRHH